MSFGSSQEATGKRPCAGTEPFPQNTAGLRCSSVAVSEPGLTRGQQEPCTAGSVLVIATSGAPVTHSRERPEFVHLKRDCSPPKRRPEVVDWEVAGRGLGWISGDLHRLTGSAVMKGRKRAGPCVHSKSSRRLDQQLAETNLKNQQQLPEEESKEEGVLISSPQYPVTGQDVWKLFKVAERMFKLDIRKFLYQEGGQMEQASSRRGHCPKPVSV